MLNPGDSGARHSAAARMTPNVTAATHRGAGVVTTGAVGARPSVTTGAIGCAMRGRGLGDEEEKRRSPKTEGARREPSAPGPRYGAAGYLPSNSSANRVDSYTFRSASMMARDDTLTDRATSSVKMNRLGRDSM